MKKIYLFLALLVVCSLSSPVFAAVVYLKNGEEIECESFRRQGGRVYVKINRDTLIDFADREVNFTKTSVSHKSKKRPTAATAPRRTVKAGTTKSHSQSNSPRVNGVFFGFTVPEGSIACLPELQDKLLSRYGKYNLAAASGDWREWEKHVLKHQAEKTQEALSGLSKKELEKRKLVLQGMAAKDYRAEACMVSHKDASAVIAGRGNKMENGKPADSHVTVLFKKESEGWKVQATMWNHSLR